MSRIGYYHLEPTVQGDDAFLIFRDGGVDRFEFVSLSIDYVIFRIVYTERSYLFGFRRGYPYNYPAMLERRIRISPETYQIAYRLSNILLAAVFCGVQPLHRHRKGKVRMEGGQLLRISSILPSECKIEVNRLPYSFCYSADEYYFSGEIEGLSSQSFRFLVRFLPLAMKAYRPYRRKPGRLLEVFTLLEEEGPEPPRKVLQMRHRRNLKMLAAQGKPATLAPPKKLAPPTTPSLFDLSEFRSK